MVVEGVSVVFIYVSLVDKFWVLVVEFEGVGVSILVLYVDSVDVVVFVVVVDEVVVCFGCIDILVNNVVVFVFGLVEELLLVDFEWILVINVCSVFVVI